MAYSLLGKGTRWKIYTVTNRFLALREWLVYLNRVARANNHILIPRETCTWKNLANRLVHDQGGRQDALHSHDFFRPSWNKFGKWVLWIAGEALIGEAGVIYHSWNFHRDSCDWILDVSGSGGEIRGNSPKGHSITTFVLVITGSFVVGPILRSCWQKSMMEAQADYTKMEHQGV